MNILDAIIFILYGVIIIFVGFWASRNKGNKEKNSTDYFLASKSLPWWLVGSSIIAANISAEQFIGMSGSGFAAGLGIATYEWLGAAILIIVAKFFLPVFVSRKIFTMPQFLAIRYDNRIKSILAVFWIVLFIFVNLTSILYLGALSLQTIFNVKLIYGIWGLALFALVYTVGGGLKSIATTDIIQVFFLIAGGLLTTFLALDAIGDGAGPVHGFSQLLKDVPEKFHMIIPKDDPNFTYLPGIRAIFGGIWIAGIYYFGANQYIIQKALGSKNLREAQRGMVFAGYLKLILPVIVVIPGIVAFSLAADIGKPDEAYPWLLNRFVPSGIKGFVFAALIAAIVSSLSAIINSTATIFTMDIYKSYIKPLAKENRLVQTGRISGIVATLIAATIAPSLGRIDQAFQFIQEYTGMVSPGITAVFLLGLFWKKTTSRAALWGILVSIIASVGLKYGFPGMPFLDQMVVAFLAVTVFMVLFSLMEGKIANDPRALIFEAGLFRTGKVFNITATIIIVILLILYIVFW
jgi:SSS family solute:Na+ symporter